MARDESPPFALGQTFFGGDSAQIDSANVAGSQLEGLEWEFEDVDYTPGLMGALPRRTGRRRRMRVVRNISGGALLPKRLVKLSVAAANRSDFGGRVDGYSGAVGQGYPVDEYLPSTGVLNGDLFWVTVEGPALCVSTATTPTIAVGDVLVSDASGKLKSQTGTPTTAEVQNAIGRSFDAVTTGNTDILISVRDQGC